MAAPSTKVNAAVAIIKHHFAQWGALPLKTRQTDDLAPIDPDNTLYEDATPLTHVDAVDISDVRDEDVPDIEPPEVPPPPASAPPGPQDDSESPQPPPPPPPLPRALRRRLAKAQAKAAKSGKPDKIVVYMHFTSHYAYFEQVSSLTPCDTL